MINYADFVNFLSDFCDSVPPETFRKKLLTEKFETSYSDMGEMCVGLL